MSNNFDTVLKTSASAALLSLGFLVNSNFCGYVIKNLKNFKFFYQRCSTFLQYESAYKSHTNLLYWYEYLSNGAFIGAIVYLLKRLCTKEDEVFLNFFGDKINYLVAAAICMLPVLAYIASAALVSKIEKEVTEQYQDTLQNFLDNTEDLSNQIKTAISKAYSITESNAHIRVQLNRIWKVMEQSREKNIVNFVDALEAEVKSMQNGESNTIQVS